MLVGHFDGQDPKDVFEIDFRYVGPRTLRKPKNQHQEVVLMSTICGELVIKILLTI